MIAERDLEDVSSQMSFEGMPVQALRASLKSTKVGGLSHLKIGDVVNVEVKALVVAITHENDEKLGGVRTHVMQALEARATEAE